MSSDTGISLMNRPARRRNARRRSRDGAYQYLCAKRGCIRGPGRGASPRSGENSGTCSYSSFYRRRPSRDRPRRSLGSDRQVGTCRCTRRRRGGTASVPAQKSTSVNAVPRNGRPPDRSGAAAGWRRPLRGRPWLRPFNVSSASLVDARKGFAFRTRPQSGRSRRSGRRSSTSEPVGSAKPPPSSGG